MPITKTDDGSIIVEGDSVEMYRLLVLRRGLDLEIRTGIRMGHGSILARLQQDGITKKGTKKGALADLNKHIKKLGGPDMRPAAAASPIARALQRADDSVAAHAALERLSRS